MKRGDVIVDSNSNPVGIAMEDVGKDEERMVISIGHCDYVTIANPTLIQRIISAIKNKFQK